MSCHFILDIFFKLTHSSAGTAGNAQQEAQALIADLPADLSTVSADQLDTLEANRKIAESAETDGFNPAIAAASGDTTALDNGKIKNKVLKLTLEVAGLQIQQAQGDDVADKITQEQTKLNKNISLDQAAAGQASQTVDV